MSLPEFAISPEGRLAVPDGKSGCPINLTVELLGDRWSLIVLRDIIFGGHRHFRELLRNSLEGIASNILSARLTKLVETGLLTRNEDPTHRQKVDYRLTEAAIELIPVFAQIGQWGVRWLPTEPELAIRAQVLAAGGPKLWEEFMEELREVHLSQKEPPAGGVLAKLTQAYQEAEVKSGAAGEAVPRESVPDESAVPNSQAKD